MALPFTPVSARPSLLSTRTRLSSGQGSNHLSEILTTSVIRARWIFHQATTASDSGGEAMWHYQVCLMKEKVDFPCNLETGTKKLFNTGGGSVAVVAWTHELFLVLRIYEGKKDSMGQGEAASSDPVVSALYQIFKSSNYQDCFVSQLHSTNVTVCFSWPHIFMHNWRYYSWHPSVSSEITPTTIIT